MTKTELIRSISEDSALTLKDSDAFLKSFITVVAEELSKGGEISLVGFGKFFAAKRKARTGRNFHTNETINVPASKAVRLFDTTDTIEFIDKD